VHSPLAATLTRTHYIPGERFSVSRATAAAIRGLFCRNERAVCWFETAYGPMVVVLVGALNVSSISTFTRGEIVSGPPREWREDSVPIDRGAEIGQFNMGSTVIVLLGPRVFTWNPSFFTGNTVRVGQGLGAFGAS
jgi:phosphatidylserine decarboxylase